MAYNPVMVGATNVGSWNEYSSFNGLTNSIEGMNNKLQTQSVVTATVPHDKRAKLRQREKNSPWKGRGETLYPTQGTALFVTDAGFTSVLNGIRAPQSSLARAMSTEEQAAAIGADVKALALLRNPEVPNNGKFDSLMTAVLSGTAKATVPPGVQPFKLYVYDTPEPGEEMYSLSASKPNGVHAALVPRPADNVNRPMRRWNIHAMAAANGRPIEESYGGNYGHAQAALVDERKAIRAIGFNGLLGGLRVLAEHGLSLAPSNPADDDNLRAQQGNPSVNLSELAVENNINLVLDNLHSMLGPDVMDPASAIARAQFYARFDPFLFGSPIADLFMNIGRDLYSTEVGAATPRAERIKFQARAAQQLFVQHDVALASWTEQIKIIPLTSGDSDGDATVLVVH